MTQTYEKKVIWLDHPAPTKDEKDYNGEGWNEAYPIGNSRIGGMIYGDPTDDIIQLNEETIWNRKGVIERYNPKSVGSYKKIRELLLEGKIGEATELEISDMYPHPQDESHYDTAGFLMIGFNHNGYSDYKRELDLANAVCTVTFNSDNHAYEREYFVSAPDNVLVMHESSSDGGKTSIKIDFSCLTAGDFIDSSLDENGVYLHYKEKDEGCDYIIAISCETVGGMSKITETELNVYDADEVTMYLTIRTDFHGEDLHAWCSSVLENAASLGYQAVKARHIEDYKSYFDRVKLSIDDDVNHDGTPTDVRLNACWGAPDNNLVGLYFDFGRYLMISCSRQGTKPANLQGIWNKDFYPAWGSRYTININTEMNFWCAENCNLSDCHMALLEHLKVMLPNGEKVAKDMYGIEGFVAHHNTDLFGDCAPQDNWISATIWASGAAWLCTHIWTHYEFTLDKDFLKEYLPIMKRACVFMKNYLFENDGKLMTGPSLSPENTYIHTSGEQGQICVGPTMDTMIVRDLFTDCIKASEVLDDEDELTDALRVLLPKLPENKIGKHGQIMEWTEDYDETEIGHRHISQLYGLYPSSQLTFEKTPELMKAAQATIERRLSHGGGGTGWSRAWIINMWARLQNGNEAGKHLDHLFFGSTYPNCFDKHSPFQIDGNFGGTAGIAEMLLQSHDGLIRLLPAIPDHWIDGSVSGLKARGDVTVNMTWKDGKVETAELIANQGGKITLRAPEGFGSDTVTFEQESPYRVVLENGKMELKNL